jgi:hypothetical protein
LQWKSFFEDEDAALAAEKDFTIRSKTAATPVVEAEPQANTLSETGPDSPEAKEVVSKPAARRGNSEVATLQEEKTKTKRK